MLRSGAGDNYDSPPPGFQPIERNHAKPVTGAGTTVLERINMATGRRAEIKELVLNSSSFDLATLRLLLNGVEIQGYEHVDTPIGESGIPATTHIDIPAGTELTLVCDHTDNAVIRYRFFGWSIPI